MLSWLRRLGRRRQVRAGLAWVACVHDQDEVMRQRAQTVASELGADDICCLEGLRLKWGRPPGHVAHHFGDFLSWMDAWHTAYYELLYQLAERALPTLRREAFGVYDWTQGTAANVLCRLACDGVDAYAIGREVLSALPHWSVA